MFFKRSKGQCAAIWGCLRKVLPPPVAAPVVERFPAVTETCPVAVVYRLVDVTVGRLRQRPSSLANLSLRYCRVLRRRLLLVCLPFVSTLDF